MLVLFVGGSSWWFFANTGKSQHDFDVGQVFVGLAYMSGVLLVSLLAMSGWRLWLVGPGPMMRQRGRRGPRDDQSIIHSQLAWGSMLVIIGAIIGALCLSFASSGISGPVLALATAVISAGAVLLPAGAATGAAGRMQQQLQDLGLPVVTMVNVTRKDGTTASLVGNVVPNRNEVDAYFEFQEAPSEDPSVTPAPIAQVQPTHHIPGDVKGQTVEGELTKLHQGKAYQVRLAAKRSTGPAVQSAWMDLGAEPTGNAPPAN